LFPGLLGCEVAYGASQHHLAQVLDAEVVTLTHDRSFRQAFHANPQRSHDCYNVMRDTDDQFGTLPKHIIGHSMGGADAAHVVRHSLRAGKGLQIEAIGFESSVGLNGQIPNLRSGIGFLREEILHARNIGDDQRRMMLSSVTEYCKNPILAAAEGILAGTANIVDDVDYINNHGIRTNESFGTNDWLIRPPTNRRHANIRDGVGHLDFCLDPYVAEDHARALYLPPDV